MVICDLEAGLGTVLRIEAEKTDLMLVVTEPTAKSLEVARRATEAAEQRAEVIVIANRVRDHDDLDAVRAVLGDRELLVIPEDPAIARADRDGLAPIDLDEDSPGVSALVALVDRLAGAPVPA